MATRASKPLDGDALLTQVFADLKKGVGDTCDVQMLGDGMFAAQPKSWISTGVTLLDAAIGGRGIPMGRITEIFGEAVTAKSLLLGSILREAQQLGAITALADTEHAWTVDYAERLCGLAGGSILYLDPETLEDFWTGVCTLLEVVRKRHPDIPVVIGCDSISGLPTRDEIGKSFDKELKIADAAKTNKRAARLLRRELSHLNGTLVVISQTIGDPNALAFAEKAATGGGKWAAFFASVRIKMERIKHLGHGGKDAAPEDGRLGDLMRATVFKDRFALAGRRVEIPVYGDRGIDDLDSVIAYAKRSKLLKTSGAWIDWHGEKLQTSMLRERAGADPAVADELRTLVRERFATTTGVEDDADVVAAVSATGDVA